MPLPDGGPMGMPPPGGPGGPGEGGPPGALPKSPMGGPGGPGGSPMMSPGAGAGNKAAAVQQVKAVMPSLLVAAMAFDSGSKEQQAILRAVQSLNPIFGKAEGANLVPAGLAAMANAQRGGGSPMAPPPPGMAGPGGPGGPPGGELGGAPPMGAAA